MTKPFSLQYIMTPAPLPQRPVDGHKGTFGHVLVIAGSRGMSGAAILSGLGALRGGAGLVTVAVPAGIQAIVAGAEPSYLTLALPEDDAGRMGPGTQPIIAEKIRSVDVVAIGPGCGQSETVSALTRWLFSTAPQPVVIDADGLNGLSSGPLPRRETEACRIFTPHPGEFSRLFSQPTREIQANREFWAAKYASDQNLILLLKGPQTITTDGTRCAINTSGNSGMGTGGCGDVLTGLIAALLGQGLSGFDAARLGAYLHGLSGDLATQELSQPALIASDLPRYLGRAWKLAGMN